MLKKVLSLMLLLSVFITSMDAQKKYRRKIEIKNEQSDDVEDDGSAEQPMEEDAPSDQEETEEVRITTRPLGKYLKHKQNSSDGVQFQPLTFIGLNAMNVQSYSNTYSTNPMNLDAKTFSSWNIGLYPIGIKANLARHKFWLNTGLGVQFFNFKYSDSVNFHDNTSSSPYDISLGNTAVKKSKLGISYLSMPLYFSFETHNKKGQANITLSAGMIGGYKLKSWTKVKQINRNIDLGGTDLNINNFYYGPMFGIGFKDVKFFASYQLNPLTKQLTGTGSNNMNAYPWVFGLQL